jgi:hypothetical protein
MTLVVCSVATLGFNSGDVASNEKDLYVYIQTSGFLLYDDTLFNSVMLTAAAR